MAGFTPAGFFEDPVDTAINAIASAPRVTFVVGAGASIEAGLPSWGTLVSRLVHVLRGRLDPVEIEAFESQLRALGVLEAAAVARALYPTPEAFIDGVFTALYGNIQPKNYAPGPLARELAAWIGAHAAATHVATLNYDDLLETAIKAHTGTPTQGRFDDAPVGNSTHVVRHLHGRLTTRTKDEIVLTERDYATWSTTAWQDAWMRRQLEHTTCVFVGLSFTDQNLLRWVYEGGGTSHFVLVARQAGTPEAPRVRAELETATDARLADAGVSVIRVNYFAELAQVLHEARRARGPGRRPRAFRQRAKARASVAERRLLPTRARTKTQERWADLLDDAVAVIRATLLAVGATDNPNERLGLGLWSVDNDRRSVRLLAASDRIYLRDHAAKEAPLALDSPWIAARAVTQGVAVEEQAHSGGRWQAIRGIPLTWTGSDGKDRIPVGALTLTSSEPFATCLLQRAEERQHGTKRAIDDELANRFIQAWN